MENLLKSVWFVSANVDYIDNLYLGNEFAPYVELLKQEGTMVGSPNNEFNPQATLTRAEFATIISRLY